jgi:vacuolar-type H+-ATPase subunit I/STV1
MVLFGIPLISDLLWMRRKVRRLAASEPAKKHATQFLWSGIFFSTLMGMAVSAWFGPAPISSGCLARSSGA